MRRIGLDQTTAWLLAVVAAGGLFTLIYLGAKAVAPATVDERSALETATPSISPEVPAEQAPGEVMSAHKNAKDQP